MPPKSSSIKRKADALDRHSPESAPPGTAPGSEATSRRPVRTNRGLGGRIQQLTNFAKETTEKRQMGSNTAPAKELPVNAPANPLAPQEKKRRILKPKVCQSNFFHNMLLLTYRMSNRLLI